LTKKLNKVIDNLRNDELYKDALSKARTNKEREFISGYVESMINSFVSAIEPLIERAQDDPEIAARLAEAFKAGSSVLNSNGPVSGSNGQK